MARRRGKSSSKQDDSWLPLEPPTGQSHRGFNEYVIPGVLLLIIAVGGSGLGWVCSEHQQTIESLSESLASMQARITKLQQQLGTDTTQLASVDGFEERLVALEDACAKAQRQVELALTTSEQIKSKDLQSKLWSLQADMNDKLAELQQNTISIAALNAIVKNKSIELEVVKQSVSTMLSANTELAIQISGFSSMLSVTKVRLDEQISVVDGLMSQLEGQNREINELKELFDSNQESFVTNTQELIDIKELLESEQIKRTQNLEKKLRSLYKRLEDHQTNTESLHLHLAAQVEALQIQFLPGVQQPDEQFRVEEQVIISNNKGEAPEKVVANIEEEEEIAGEEKNKEDDTGKEEEEFNTGQAVAEEVKANELPVKKLAKEIQTPSEELDVEIEEDVSEGKKVVDITEEIETLQEAHMFTDEIGETVEDQIQTALVDSDHVTVETGEIMDDKVEVPVGEEINSEKASETEKLIESDAEEIQSPLEDLSISTTEIEDTAMEKEVDLTPAQEMETGSEVMDAFSDTIDDVLSEEHAKHAADKIHNISSEISTLEIKTQEDGNAEQETETEAKEIPVATDETDVATNGNVDSQMRDDIPDETEQEAAADRTAASAKESDVSEKSASEV